MTGSAPRTTVVIAEWLARPGAQDAVAAALSDLAAATRAEEGNLDYRVFVDRENPRSFLLLEEYADAQALAAHRASTHFQEIGIPIIENKLEHRRARVLAEEETP